MPRRLTDTYFAKCTFSIFHVTSPQRLSTKTSVGVYAIPEMESIGEYIQTETERQVKCTCGNDYKIVDFAITEITPL